METEGEGPQVASPRYLTEGTQSLSDLLFPATRWHLRSSSHCRQPNSWSYLPFRALLPHTLSLARALLALICLSREQIQTRSLWCCLQLRAAEQGCTTTASGRDLSLAQAGSTCDLTLHQHCRNSHVTKRHRAAGSRREGKPYRLRLLFPSLLRLL